jgi:hypothetical protein
MANKFEKIGADIQTLFDEVLEEHHQELIAIGVSFDILIGYAPKNDEGERTGPALKIHGLPTNSMSGIVNLKNRVKGNADAEIILDGDTWPTLQDDQKKAILDRALEYFVVARNIDGEVIMDTHGRPKLKMRQPDWNFSLFNSIAARHGAASPEVETMKSFAKTQSETYFSFMQIEDGGQAPAPKKKSAPKKPATPKADK